MAEYLLKGGKMLAKTCPACNSPLFEVKGRTFCVVCEEEAEERQSGKEGTGVQEATPGGALQKKENRRGDNQGNLQDGFEAVIRILLSRAESEADTTRLNAIMQAVKTAAESYAIICQAYGRRDNS